MTQEEKQLLLKDLCARLPYEVKVLLHGSFTDSLCKTFAPSHIFGLQRKVIDVKPYLRPMSSMTEEEKKEFNFLINGVEERCINAYGKGGYTLAFTEVNDWLNAHYFDYRSLIPIGLALEAPEGMYNINEK